MYFPSDMTFQYFFFDTYLGLFLQAVPFALLGGLLFAVYQRKKRPEVSGVRRFLPALFVCYLTGLVCLTLFERFMGEVYYRLFYHHPSGRMFRWFEFGFYMTPDFFRHWTAENIGNILMYLPFGFLYPLYKEGSAWLRTMACGMGTSLVIELLQPIFGRSFDINDIILNTMGVILSATAFFVFRSISRRRKVRPGRRYGNS